MPISFIVLYFHSLFVLPGCCDEKTSAPANSQKLSFSEWQIATTSRLFPELWLTWFWINLFYEIIIKKKPEILVPFYTDTSAQYTGLSFRLKNHTGYRIPDTGYRIPYWTGYWFKHEELPLAPFLCRGTASAECCLSWKPLSPIRLQERCNVNRQSDCSEIENPDIRALRHVSSEKHQ